MSKAKNKNEMPEWYWSGGLHDAEILSVNRLEIPYKQKAGILCTNCFEINLDSTGAVFETNVKKISLYNYKIKNEPIDTNSLNGSWWLQDSITKIADNKFNLKIVIQKTYKNNITVDIDFEAAEVERE